MPQEIERKFLVTDDRWRAGVTHRQPMAQGYLSTDPDRTVRVRIAADLAWLTIKGPTHGISRAEYEYAIPVEHARGLLDLCAKPPLEKVRHYLPFGDLVWEIDVFEGPNDGLVVAELELPDAHYPVDLPDWIGQEVSGQRRFYNSQLLLRPYTSWID